jgi:hypothetical protein
MNPVERVLDSELMGLLDRLAASVPGGTIPAIMASQPTLRSRLDEVDTRLAEARTSLLADYARWQRALEDVENLWALASWRSAAQEPVEEGSMLAA